MRPLSAAAWGQGADRMIGIVELWRSPDAQVWDEALARYWDFVQPGNLDFERQMESLEVERIRRLDAHGWYDFLLNEYFRWKRSGRRC